jgi:hypothetical protein
MAVENSASPVEGTDLSAEDAAMLAFLGEDDEETLPQADSDDTPDADADDEAPDAEVEGDDAEPDEPSPEPEPTKKYKVKVRGEELEVEEPELLAGYSRTADYTRDKMALAEEKRAIAAERQTYVQKLTAAEQLLAAQATEPDWNQLEQTLTPDEFAFQYAKWTQHQRNLEKVQAERTREEQKLHQDWIEHRNAQAVVEQQKVLDLIPEWSNPTVRDKHQQEAVAFALKMGFTTEQLQNVFSATEIAVLHKAAQFDKLQQRAKSAKPMVTGKQATTSVAPSKPKAVPRVGPPPAETQYKKERTALRKSGSLDDATKVFLNFID